MKMPKNLQKAMLIGLYLSKFDKEGLQYLGFESFSEAYNTIGLAIDVKPLSIKNYRDEFDPFFPNNRKGWHKRPMYPTRKKMLSKYGDINIVDFTRKIKTIIYQNPDVDLLEEKISEEDDSHNTFAKRLITGQAAEQYFKDNFKKIKLFKNLEIEDTTKLGCGFDFKLNFEGQFYAIEVKGLGKNNGSLMLTSKEYRIATLLKSNYFIFLVKNFLKKPNHQIFRNPIFEKELEFTKKEKIVNQISWSTQIN